MMEDNNNSSKSNIEACDDRVPSPPNVMEPIEDPGMEDEPIHDQLPSVEEAKANADLDGSTDPKATWISRCRFCFFTSCCLCSVFVLLLVLVAAIPMSEEQSKNSSSHHSGSGGSAGTLAPGTYESRFDAVRDFLTAVSSTEDLDRATSPQRRAAQWIADEDLLHLPVDDVSFVERYALAVLYYSMNGPNWALNLGFLTERLICDWFHIGFGSDDKPRYVGAHCGEGQRIEQLFFPEKWLKGTFPSELRLLEELNYISIYRNPGMTGGFPSVLRQLPKLEYLAMHFCDLTGPLPDWIGEMTQLTSLILSNNRLTGTIPTSISKLTKLTQLFLDDNGIKGDIKTLQTMHELQALMLEDNQFYGGLDESMVRGWQRMELLDISSNNLTFTIPADLFSLKNLTVVDLHGNQFTGVLPEIAETNKALKFLALHDNSLQGAIPSSIELLGKLSHLDLSDNLLTGDLPFTFEHLTDMKYLFLSLNAFNKGIVPPFLQGMTALQDLSLKATSRTGTVPHFLGLMSTLVLLDLNYNDLTGTIPRSLGDLDSLKFLLLNRNQLQGTIPNSFESLTNLDFLMLERNDLNGTAKHICDREKKPQVFMADCAELQCPCCSACCADNEVTDQCDDQVWLGGVDPIWETKYERTFYQFEKVKLKKGDE